MNPNGTERLHVGVVEDEARLCELLIREITAMGHEAWGVSTAEQAWVRISNDADLDVLILDLNLPGMAGMELFGRIRDQRSDLAVVILTGFGSMDSAVQSVRWKAEDYLTKPCSLSDIDRALSRVLMRKREQERSVQLHEPEQTGQDLQSGTPGRGAGPAGATLADMERERILEALEALNGNKPAVAAQLGISLRTLYNRLNVYRHEGYEV